MSESKHANVDKAEIVQQIAHLSKLLAMIPDDDTVAMREPVAGDSTALSEWLNDARNTFLKVSLLVDKAMDLNLS